ncbi:stress protein [Nakamurella silvestris]|nr:stress protein [Nakamurella silvestris]
MTVRLIKGQNLAWAGNIVKVVVEVAAPTDVSALLLGPNGRVRSEHDFVFYNQATAPGVSWSTGRHQQITVDLRTLDVPSLMCLISVDPGAPPLGSVTPPRAVLLDENDSPVTDFLVTGLTTERAVIAWEIYRRGPAWKVRAIGQGYDGGLAEAVTVHGVEVEEAAPTHTITPPPRLADAVAPTPPGTSDQERLYRQSVGIFEDAARSTVGFRSAVSFAEKRRDDELSAALADPAARNAPGSSAAREATQRRYEDLVSRARADHRKDITQLSAELAELQHRLPAPMSDWNAAAWQQWRPATQPAVATQAGHLSLPEAPDFQMPMLVGLPLSRPLWIDTAGAFNPGAGVVSPDDLSSLEALGSADHPAAVPPPTAGGWQAMTKALVVRFLAACPVGGIKLQISDLAGRGSAVSFLGPLNHSSSVLAGPIATTGAELSQMLTGLVERVDLIEMARRAGSLDSLSGELDAAERLVVLTDFPYGFDDSEIAKVRFLAEEGAAAGVQLLVIGSHAEIEGRGPLVASFFRGCLRLPVEPDDHLGDGWTGTTWTFNPDMGPADGALLDRILGQVANSPQG